MVLVGGHWQGWFQPTGSPWKPPCCASYLRGVPTNLSWHQFPSSSILAMSLTWVSLWPTTKTYIFWPVRGWGHFLWQWGSNVIVIFFFYLAADGVVCCTRFGSHFSPSWVSWWTFQHFQRSQFWDQKNVSAQRYLANSTWFSMSHNSLHWRFNQGSCLYVMLLSAVLLG